MLARLRDGPRVFCVVRDWEAARVFEGSCLVALARVPEEACFFEASPVFVFSLA